MHPLQNRDYALVFAANNAFSPGFLVALASALATSNLDQFNIYLLHDHNEAIDDMKISAQSLCQRFNFPKERFDTIPVDLQAFESCDAYAGNYLAYARMHAIHTLKESKILYLDSDMLILGDLAELIQSIPDTATCAAALDSVILTHNNDGYLLDGEPGPGDIRYFNSGLLILDTKKCHEIKLFDQFIELTTRVENAQYADQSFLNIILKDNWFEISKKWNRMTSPGNSASIISESGTTQLLHYITQKKPWRHSTPDCANILWHTVAKSINVEVDTAVYRTLLNQVRILKLRKRWGIMQLKHVYYKLRGKTGKKSKQLNITEDIIARAPMMDNWLTIHGFNKIPESLRVS
jgi:lipopolysaccharide biosynthesis glycosyltransferase